MLKDNLKTIRKYRHFSQEKLADKIGVSRQSVSKWETGEAYPTMTNLQVICSVLNCKINDLLDAESDDLNNFSEKDRKDISLLKEKDRNRLIKISKIIYFIAKIARFASLFGFVILGVAVFVLRYTIRNYLFLDMPEANGLNFASFVQYGALAKLLLVVFVIICFFFAILCLYRVFYETEKFFKNVSQGKTLFELNNVLSLKKISKNLLFWTIFDNLPKLILLFIQPLSSIFSINAFSIVFALIALCFSYIFQYGNILERA